MSFAGRLKCLKSRDKWESFCCCFLFVCMLFAAVVMDLAEICHHVCISMDINGACVCLDVYELL